MNGLWKRMENIINDYSIRKKLMLFYICCVLLPLFITDSVILTILLRTEQVQQKQEMENVAGAVRADLSYTFDEISKMANTLYINREIYEFLDKEYTSELHFFNASRSVESKSFYVTSINSGSIGVVLCGDNETLVNGGHFYKLSSVRDEEWCEKILSSGKNTVVHFYYIGDENPSAFSKRKVSVIRRLNYFKDLKSEKLVRIDLEYSTLVRRLANMKYTMPVYVCSGDRILFSNAGHNKENIDYEMLTGKEKIGVARDFDLYGESLRILVLETESDIFDFLKNHFLLISLMIAFNILLPWALTVGFNRSFTVRLGELSEAFNQVEAESLKEIENIRGSDEIGSLMKNYNRMVLRSRELIKTVYKDRLEKQKMDIARQNAELLALHSQINPHFLFNVLESIRMHSVIKGEEETAGMIERLAVLERQNVNWKSDFIRISEELAFIEAYLELQKYRFGDRLSYQIEAQKDCLDFILPKLTLVTFVENACVHGIEKKAVPCWIYIHVYRKGDWLYLEIEDTGGGMDEETVEELRARMQVSNIDALMNNEHVGIVNACLRLKMVTGGATEFELESEERVGTFMVIKVPVEKLDRG